jgi:DNA-binding XRE family transcriptional regulator
VAQKRASGLQRHSGLLDERCEAGGVGTANDQDKAGQGLADVFKEGSVLVVHGAHLLHTVAKSLRCIDNGLRFRYVQAKSDRVAKMTPQQCKMARAALGLGVRELAEMADVSTNTITRLEAGEDLKSRTVAAIQAALEKAGAEFIPENGGGPGVRMRKSGEAHG